MHPAERNSDAVERKEMGLCSMRWYDDNSMWGGSGRWQEAVGNETQRPRKSHGRFPSSGSWQPEERAVCPCPSGTARRERGGPCQSVYQSHRSKKPGQSVARLPHWLHAQQSSLSNQLACNMRRSKIMELFSGGKQDYVLRNAKRATRKYTPNTLKYLRGIETQRTIFANQMGVFRDTRWTSAHAELNTHTLTCQD